MLTHLVLSLGTLCSAPTTEPVQPLQISTQNAQDPHLISAGEAQTLIKSYQSAQASRRLAASADAPQPSPAVAADYAQGVIFQRHTLLDALAKQGVSYLKLYYAEEAAPDGTLQQTLIAAPANSERQDCGVFLGHAQVFTEQSNPVSHPQRGLPELSGHAVSPEFAVESIQRYQSKQAAFLRSALANSTLGGDRNQGGVEPIRAALFASTSILRLLSQPGVEGLKLYYGLNSASDASTQQTLVAVGVNSKGQEIGFYLDHAALCPPNCPTIGPAPAK